MKDNLISLRGLSRVMVLGLFQTLATGTAQAQSTVPEVSSWFTTDSGKYAHIYTNDSMKASGVTVTTWSNATQTQSAPAYCGVQAVYSSSNWVYIRSTGLGSHIMGPWYLDLGHLTNFPNLPVNTRTFFRIPLTPAVTTNKTVNGGGAIGYFVDGVCMFNSWDAYYWDGTGDTSGAGSGDWNRDAYVNEGPTFDPAYAHQPQDGTYHYHASPIALRYLLGDHVDYNSTTKSYTESTNTPVRHSPILAWVKDGFPLYGPYGYSNPTNPASGVRRMISGYVLRNGQNGTDNLATVGRTNLPLWAVRFYSAAITNSGPTVSANYPLGRYMEDNAYLGDLGQTQGGGVFDLDEYNGRFCVTPEFPDGTYAYFVNIASNGTPIFPYNIGRAYYGNPTGGAITNLTETVTTNFTGGPDSALAISKPTVNPAANTVTLVWSSVEGGTYQVETSTNLSSWTTNLTGAASQGISTQTNLASAASPAFFRIARTALATYDSVTNTTTGGTGGTGGTGILSISPTSGNRGTVVTLTVNLDPAANPAPPPQTAPINSITVGSITGAGNNHVSTTQVTSSLTIPANAAPGAQTVTVIFPGPPANPTATVTYTLVNGFTIK